MDSDLPLAFAVAVVVFIPAAAAIWKLVVDGRRKRRWRPGVAKRLDEGLRVEREGFTASVETDDQGPGKIRVDGPFAPVAIHVKRGESRLSGTFDAEGDPALLVALLDDATREAAIAFVRAGGTLADGEMRMESSTNPDLVVEWTRIALDLAVRVRHDRGQLGDVLRARFRDRTLTAADRRHCLEWLVENEPSASPAISAALDDESPLVRSLARLLSPGHRIFHVAERNPAELAREISRTRPTVRSRIVEALTGIGEPAEPVLAALLADAELRTDPGDADRPVEELEKILNALALGGTSRVLAALHAFAASGPPGGSRLIRGANEAIARIRARHPETSGGQLTVVESSATAGALSDASAERGALSLPKKGTT